MFDEKWNSGLLAEKRRAEQPAEGAKGEAIRNEGELGRDGDDGDFGDDGGDVGDIGDVGDGGDDIDNDVANGGDDNEDGFHSVIVVA